MDKLSPERRSLNMSRIRAKNTSPELIVRRIVHSLGFRYRLHVPSLPGKPDLVFPRLKRIIDVRGCFWHQHSLGCPDSRIPRSRLDYWQPKLKRNCERDVKNARQLRRCGWSILVVWECETRDLAKLAIRLIRFLNQK